MPLEYEVEADTGLVRLEAVGEVGLHEYDDVWQTMLADSRVATGPTIVADFTEVVVKRTGAEVRSVAAGSKALNEILAGGHMAVIASGQAAFGLARMYEALVEATGLQVRVFRDADEGLAWAREALEQGD